MASVGHPAHFNDVSAYAETSGVALDCLPVRRVLVPVDSLGQNRSALVMALRICATTGAVLRLVHVRLWDRMPRGGGRYFLETSRKASDALDASLFFAWRTGAEASGVVLDAARPRMAEVLLTEAARWHADTMILTLSPRRSIFAGVWDRVARQIVRKSSVPVLLVHPGKD
jgi:nucleotide-binding universal stress UspA family protein